MSEINQVLVIFSVASFILLGLILYGLISIVRRMKKTGEDKAPSQVSFVVDTFHDLVAQLKEKESELESLRKRAEERADIMEDYNENILQSVHSGVVSMDASWKVVKANSPAVSILGLQGEEMTGRDGREIFSEIIQETEGSDGTTIWSGRGELRYAAPSGRKLWLGYSLSPLRDALGTEIGRLLVFTDLTELKALEEQSALRKRLSSLGEMGAGIAHELRNPMGVISGYTRMLSKKVDPSAVSIVDAIAAEVEVMDRIISDFLGFARPRELELLDINLRGLVASCVEKAASVKGDSTPAVAVSIDSGITLSADEVMLRQVFTNLIQNAMEATPPEGNVSLEARIEGERVVINVSDTGHGIEKPVADRIFNPFFTTKEEGTGLGLALVHRIITSHSGTITLKTGEGGTVFSISLPKTGPASK
jgi:PAS domain S-box-containing protein